MLKDVASRIMGFRAESAKAIVASPLARGGTAALEELSNALREPAVLAFALSGAINLLYFAPSLYMLQVYDRVLQSGSALTLVFLSVVAAVALVCLAALDAVRARVLGRMGIKLDLRLAPMVLKADFDARGQGRPVAAATGMRDLETVRQTVASPAAATILDLPWTPLFLAVCFVIHAWIGFAALAGVIVMLAVALLNERASRKSLALVAERSPVYYGGVESDMRLAEIARSLGLVGRFVKRRLRERELLLAAQTRAAFIAADYGAATKFVRMGLQSLMLGLGAFLALSGQISAGAIIAATILSARAFQPIEQVVGAWRQIGQGRLALASLRKLLAGLPEPAARTALPAPRGAVSLEMLTGRPPMAERPSLYGVTFRAEPGEIIGVVGPSGAGKTTLARLLANAASPAAGLVRLDGAAYGDWDPEALAAHIGYLPQTIDLAGGTIAENIARFSGAGASNLEEFSAAVVSAAKEAGAHELILRLPQGYETPLGAQGAGLSTGQGQRIALARALFGRPHLLVLDEPNAHLDADGEAALVAALKAHKARGGVAFVIAHRAGLLAVADRIIALQDGRLVEAGPRDAVAARLARPRAVSGEPS